MPRTPPDSRPAQQGAEHNSQTRPSIHQDPAPRLPHERDESGDSQTSAPREVMRQAKRDVDAGLVDTDRGTPMNEVYHRAVKRPA